MVCCSFYCFICGTSFNTDKESDDKRLNIRTNGSMSCHTAILQMNRVHCSFLLLFVEPFLTQMTRVLISVSIYGRSHVMPLCNIADEQISHSNFYVCYQHVLSARYGNNMKQSPATACMSCQVAYAIQSLLPPPQYPYSILTV